MSAKNERMAKRIADHLFGHVRMGVPATRLVLSGQGEDANRTGWGKQPVIDTIYQMLEEADNLAAKKEAKQK